MGNALKNITFKCRIILSLIYKKSASDQFLVIKYILYEYFSQFKTFVPSCAALQSSDFMIFYALKNKCCFWMSAISCLHWRPPPSHRLQKKFQQKISKFLGKLNNNSSKLQNVQELRLYTLTLVEEVFGELWHEQ